jgi:hypothetical protein
MHYLLSTLYVYSILLDAVSDYHVTPPVNPDNTAPQLWLVRALTIFFEFFLSQRSLRVPLWQTRPGPLWHVPLFQPRSLSPDGA